MFAGAVGGQGLGQAGGGDVGAGLGALHCKQQGAKEELGADQGRGGVSGQAEHAAAVAQDSEPGRLARAHLHRLDPQVQSQPRHRRLGQVVVANRGAADGDDQVAAGILQRTDDGLDPVPRGFQLNGDAAPKRDQRRQRGAAGIEDLFRPGLGSRGRQFLAGRKHDHPRRAGHGQAGAAGGGGQADAPGVETHARRQQQLAGAEIPAAWTHVASLFGRGHADALAFAGGFFLDDDPVGAGGNRGAGEDAHRLARRQGSHVAVARRALADDGEVGIGPAQGPAVHGRGIEGRLVAGGADRLGQNPAARGVQAHGLDLRFARRGQHPRAGVLDRQVLHGASRRKSPDAPPVFSIRRTASMVMALSAALSMS